MVRPLPSSRDFGRWRIVRAARRRNAALRHEPSASSCTRSGGTHRSERLVSAPDKLSTAEAASRWRALQTLHLDPPAFLDDWAVYLLPDDEQDALRGPAGLAEFRSNTRGWAMSGVGVGCLRYGEDVVLAAAESGV